MIDILNDFIDVHCNKCGIHHNILRKDFVTPIKDYALKSMGDEIEYLWQFRVNCPACNRLNSFDILAYEYPPKFMNWKDHTNYGGSIRMSAIKFGGDIYLSEDIDDEDN